MARLVSMIVRSCLALAVFRSTFSYKLSENYESGTAIEKQEEMWDIITSASGGRWSVFHLLNLPQIPFSDVTPSVDHRGDTKPYNHIKLIHSVGAVGKGVWQSVGDHTYSGMFQGETNLLVRYSSGFYPGAKFIPGAAIKFFRDGIPSANLLILDPVNNQVEGGNFFTQNFSNHIPIPPTRIGRLLRKFLSSNFENTAPPARMVGTSDIALTDRNGNEVEDLIFPYELRFIANSDFYNQFKDNTKSELEELFKAIPPGTKIWDVLARSHPDDWNWLKIAELTSTSEIVYSKAGDDFLFFRHQRMTDDVALHPEWSDSVFHLLPDEDPDEQRRLSACPGMRNYLKFY